MRMIRLAATVPRRYPAVAGLYQGCAQFLFCAPTYDRQDGAKRRNSAHAYRVALRARPAPSTTSCSSVLPPETLRMRRRRRWLRAIERGDDRSGCLKTGTRRACKGLERVSYYPLYHLLCPALPMIQAERSGAGSHGEKPLRRGSFSEQSSRSAGPGRERAGVEIWPAIDLRGGRCVRLRQGDYAQETVFGEDPAAMARHWVDQGAKRLHLVDLDGAKLGKPGNLASVQSILAAVTIPCELGGGIRDESTIEELLHLGLARLVIGTLALREPDWFRRMCQRFPGRLVLGIDARDGRVATDGWLETSTTAADELARQFTGEPLAAIVYTDIATDGMLAGPNVAAMAAMQRAVDVPVVASGGVTTRDDIARLAAAGLAGCIIGRALYEGTLSLPEALAAGGDN